MALADISIKVEMPRRRAVADLSPEQAKRYGLGEDAGHYDCFVLATLIDYEYIEYSTVAAPIFVCEFFNGIVGNVYTERVSFIYTDEEGGIIE